MNICPLDLRRASVSPLILCVIIQHKYNTRYRAVITPPCRIYRDIPCCGRYTRCVTLYRRYSFLRTVACD